jgi:hypothetical protein
MIMPRATPEIAVVGAGVAGLACASRLAEHGLQVQVYDEGRQPGGRVARRHRMGLVFEHGARGYHELVRNLADRVTVMTRTRITAVAPAEGGGWRLFTEGQPLRVIFGSLVLALPAPQAAPLLRTVAPELAARLAPVGMRPLLTAMVGLPAPLGRPLDNIRFTNGSVAEAIRLPRPQADGAESWVLHAADRFSRDNLECDADAVAQHLWMQFQRELGVAPPPPVYLRGHRWRHALTEVPLGEPYLLDDTTRLGVCGDWCLGDQVEAARTSGRSLAARLLGIAERPERRPLREREEKA